MKKIILILLTVMLSAGCEKMPDFASNIGGKWQPPVWISPTTRVLFTADGPGLSAGKLEMCGFTQQWEVAKYVIVNKQITFLPVDSRVDGTWKIEEMNTSFKGGTVEEGKMVLRLLDEGGIETDSTWTFTRP